MQDKRKWVKSAFHGYYKNKAKLPQMKLDYERIPIPGGGSGNFGNNFSDSGGENGTEKSVLKYLIDRERLEKAIKDCENKIAVVDKTLQHFSIEEHAKGKKHCQYIRCRFLRNMSYTRAAVECDLRERTSDFVIEEILTVAYAIAEMEGYI